MLGSKYALKGIKLKNRFEHSHILAGIGQGKTSLIQYLVARDLEEDCTVIVIDNQRQMIPNLARLGYDMQLISPQYPLALNIFDMKQGHTTATLLRYVLAAIMNAPLTPKQELIFEFSVALILSIRGNINTFQRLLDGEHFDLSKVDDTTRLFFETQFYTRQYEQTRQEISWRIWSLLKNPTLRDMFSANENRCQLDFSKKLILIDTDIHLLQEYTGMFGRFFLAQLMLASYERFEGSHKPCYVYIDECYYYLDSSVVTMMETARKAKVGLIMAHQYLGQITEPRVSDALTSLTSTKFAGALSPSDKHKMAQAMHTYPEALDVPKLRFALWQRGEFLQEVKTPVGVIEKLATQPVPHEEMIDRYGRRKPIFIAPEPKREPMITYDDDDIVPSDKL